LGGGLSGPFRPIAASAMPRHASLSNALVSPSLIPIILLTLSFKFKAE